MYYYYYENGIADAKDDRRALYIKRYIYAMKKAIGEGSNIKDVLVVINGQF